MKVLQFSYKVPFPLTDGGAVSVYHCSRSLLANKIKLMMFAADQITSIGDIQTAPKEWLESVDLKTALLDNSVKAAGAFVNLFQRKSYFSSRFFSKTVEKKLIEILQNNAFDIVQLEHLNLCEYIGTIRKYSNAAIILRAQNVEHQIWLKYLESKNNLFIKAYLKLQTNRLKRFEIASAKSVDGIIALSEIDKNWFNKHASAVPTIAIPIGMEIAETDHSNTKPSISSPLFYHLGSMDWRPNDEGMRWFLKDIFPKIAAEHPNFKIHLAGKKMPHWYYQQANNNIIVDGQIADAIDYQLKKDVLIVPLLSGSGIRVKILEAMALGKVVISTPKGAEGLPVVHNTDILIAKTPSEFVDCIGQLLRQPDRLNEIGTSAKETIKNHFGIQATGALMVGFYKSIIAHQ